MNLPHLTGRAPTRRQEISFGGLNLTDGARAGELRACSNVSTRRYPVLSPRRGRTLVSDDNATSVFEWDGKLVKVVGTSLYYGSDLIGSVTAGEKQFAVVNTKLCIWPDKVFVDLTQTPMAIKTLAPKYITNGVANSITFTHNTITVSTRPVVDTVDPDDTPQFVISLSDTQDGYLYVYGNDKDAVAECYGEDGWDMTALGEIEALAGICYPVTGSSSTKALEIGDIVIPADPYTNLVTGRYSYDGGTDTLPDKTDYNAGGNFAVINEITAEENPLDSSEMFYFIKYTVYNADVTAEPLSDDFKAGRGVDVSGTAYGMADAEKAFIKAIDDETNSLVFADNTFFIPTACRKILVDFYPNAGDSGWARFTYGEDEYYFKIPDGDCIPANTVACLTDGTSILIWDIAEKRIIKEYATSDSPATPYGRNIEGYAYDTSEEIITIEVPVPAFDFICESSNRLWGVSNSQENTIWNEITKKFDTYTSRCIYASALGDPTNFWTFEGLSTDSWQVAVGSEGDFTGLCAYDGVLAWKEQKLYRISGSYPAEYYMFDRDVEGVQKGSGKSLTVIDETLYYKGRDGVYAYRGGAPQLVSSVFGNHRYGSAVSGNDGQRLYISMKEDDTWGLYVYDTMTGLWAHEDGTRAAQVCRLDGKLLLLTNTGALLELDDDGWTDPEDAPVVWSAVFAPFDERDMHERKYYLRILLRTDIGTGGELKVYVKAGHDDWRLTHTLDAGTRTVVIPIFPYRIDELMVKLEGTGNASVLSLAREYTVGSIYGEEGVAT